MTHNSPYTNVVVYNTLEMHLGGIPGQSKQKGRLTDRAIW